MGKGIRSFAGSDMDHRQTSLSRLRCALTCAAWRLQLWVGPLTRA